MRNDTSSVPRFLEDRSDLAQRWSISLSCRIVIWLAHSIGRIIGKTQTHIALAIGLITLFPLVLIVPNVFRLPAPITPLNRFIFVIWPGLLALATTTFAWQATKHLSESESLFTSLLRDSNSCDAIHEWRKFFRTWPQVLMAFALGSFGAIGGFVMVRQLGVGLVASISGAFSVLISGFMGGLGFYIGALSPLLTSTVSRCEFDLYPFAPATTPEIREIAWCHGRIVFKGMIVGVVLSSPLLYLVSQYTLASLRSMFIIAIVTAWLAVISVSGLVQYHLSRIILKSKVRTRSHLHILIKRAYETLDQAEGREIGRLQDLLELDKLVQASGRFAIDARVVLQVISSLITAVVPLALQSCIRR
jgi:hypothetical protein